MSAAGRRRFAVVAMVFSALLASAVPADDGAAGDDADLLEFIGSWEGDDDWLELLDDVDEKAGTDDADQDDQADDEEGDYE